jgi:hypothetical protein
MKFILLGLFIIFTVNLLGDSISEKSVLKKGDPITVKDCDKHGWCQLENGYYVKEFFLKKVSKSYYFVNAKNLYIYKKIERKVSKKDFQKHISSDSKKNYFYGYVRLQDYQKLNQ